LKELEKERVERRKVRTKMKPVTGPSVPVPADSAGPAVPAPAPTIDTVATDVEMGEASSIEPATTADTNGGETSGATSKAKDTSGENLEQDEFTVRQKEVEEFSKLVDESVKTDIGASSTGLYELVGWSTSSLPRTC
jgi:ubiquitin carboxyl-terminal hydrolase 14